MKNDCVAVNNVKMSRERTTYIVYDVTDRRVTRHVDNVEPRASLEPCLNALKASNTSYDEERNADPRWHLKAFWLHFELSLREKVRISLSAGSRNQNVNRLTAKYYIIKKERRADNTLA